MSFGGFGGFGGGQPLTSTTSTAPTIGGGGFSFGLPSASTSQTTSTTSFGSTFGLPTSSTQTTSTAPTFGISSAFGSSTPAQTTTISNPTTSFGTTSFGGLGQLGGSQPLTAATSTAPAPSFGSTFSFGIPTVATTQTTSTAPTFGTTFGIPTASTTSSVSFGTFGAPTTTVAQTTTTSTPAQGATNFGGLGGFHSSTGEISVGSGFFGSAKMEGRALMELPVPQEILQIVEDLKIQMKNHKVKMTELGRASDKAIDKVVEEIEDARLEVSNLTNLVHRQILFCKTLMEEIQDEIKNVDMAMVTRDTPLVLQNEITAPINYFCSLINHYQERMINFKREIERAETALCSLVDSQGFSSKDLLAALKGTKETVMALAAKVQDLHERVVTELITHRNLKRFAMDDEKSSWTAGTPTRQTGTGSSIGLKPSTYNRMDSVIPPNINANYHRVYDRVNVLFNTPQTHRPGPASSTPIFSHTGYTSQPPLFQTASSTILGSPGITGGSLKRSKR